MEQQLTFRLGETVLDLNGGTLRTAGKMVALRPNTVKLLGYLMRNAGRVVTKEELLDAVWPQSLVSEDSLTQCISDARRSIGDDEHRIIRTIPRQGYVYDRFGFELDLDQSPPYSSSAFSATAASPERTVAVLPFKLGGASEVMRSEFALMAKAITTALSTSPAIAARQLRSSNRASAIEVGTDYLVEGHVESVASHAKMVVTLSEAGTKRRLLTQTFFIKPENILAFRQAVARQVVSALVFNIETSAWKRTPQGTSVTHRW